MELTNYIVAAFDLLNIVKSCTREGWGGCSLIEHIFTNGNMKSSSTLVYMTTMLSEQKYILDLSHH